MTISVDRASVSARVDESHALLQGLRSGAGRLLAILITGILALAGVGAVVAPTAQAAATDSSGFIYTANDTSVSVQGCNETCTGASVTIPSTMDVGGNTLPVTSVATNNWTQTGRIASLTIPSSVTSIGGYFNGKDIVSIVFAPNSGVTVIPDAAFSSMSSLRSITLPDRVQVLGNYAFKYDSNLRSIVLPDTITTIGSGGVFDGTGITSLNVPTSLVTIGSGAFQGTISGALVMPPNVTTIGDSAFRGGNITSLTLNSQVTSIASNAFALNQLTSLTLPPSLQTIGSRAFERNQLTSLTIPSSVTSIGDYAFAYNNFTSTPTVPAGTSVGTGLFASEGTESNGVKWVNSGAGAITIVGCEAACQGQSVVIPSSIGGLPVTSVATNNWTQTGQIASLTIPSSVTSIGGYFNGKDIVSIVFAPNSGVTVIPDAAFSSMSSLRSITLPDRVQVLGNYAFKYDSNLSSIVLPDTITTIGSGGVFDGTGITSLNIPTSLVTIGSGAFQGKISGALVMPPNVTTIGDSAFRGSNITSLTLNSQVTSIASNAFALNQLTSVTLPRKSADNWVACIRAQSVDVVDDSKSSVTSIGDYAFAYNNFTSTPTVPAGTSVGTGLFASEGTESNGVKWVNSGAGAITIVGCEAACQGQSVVIPSSIGGLPVTSVATNNWTQTGQIASLTIPSSVTSIGGYFNGKDIVSIVFAPNSGVTVIPDAAFSSMSSLRSITLPDRVQVLGNYAFKYDSNLSSIVLPDTITTIGSGGVFDGTGITSLNIPTSLVTIGSGAFQGKISGALVMPPNVTTIGDSAFRGSNITSLTLNSQVTSIDSNAFALNQLTSVTLPASLRTIGSRAFSNNRIASVTVPPNVLTLSSDAFAENTNGGATASAQLTYVPPTFTNLTPPDGVIGTPYSWTFGASGASLSVGSGVQARTRVQVRTSSATLPAGLTLNSQTGVVSGTPSAVGTYTFGLNATNAGGTYSSDRVTIEVVSDRSLSGVSPSSGTTAGGTEITITGTNFTSGGLFGVTVGGVAATNVTLVSSTSITATTPAGSAGAVNVTVTNSDGQSASSVRGFTYLAPAGSESGGGSGSGSGNSSGSSGSGSVSATPSSTSVVQVPSNSVDTAVSTASDLDSLTVLSGADAAKATVVEVSKPVSTDPASAPSVSVISGAAVAPVAQGLPSSSTFTASVSLGGRTATPLGVTTSNASGQATVPAFQATEAGVYTIALSDGKGRTYYLKIEVAAAPSGVGLPSDSDAAKTVLVSVAAPVSTNAASAPTANVAVGTPVAPVIGGLPANTVITVDISSTGQTRAKTPSFVRIGSGLTNSKGRMKLPAFKASRAGTFMMRMTTPAGKAYYLKVKVTAKAKPIKKPAAKPAVVGKSRA
jgi:predicted ribosome-associated RNA-binding protein Tma20